MNGTPHHATERVHPMRDNADAWSARLATAVGAGHLDDLSFIQSVEHARGHAHTGWEAVRLVAEASPDSWTGGQFLLRHLPGRLGRIAYLPRGPITVAPDEAAAAETRAMFAAALRDLRSDGVSLIRLELGSHRVISAGEDQVAPPEALTVPLRAPWLSALAGAGFRIHRAGCVQPRSSRLINVQPGAAAVAAAYDPELHRYEAQAHDAGLTAVPLRGADAAISLKEIMDAVAARTGINRRPGSYYRNLLAAYADAAELLIVRDARSALLGAHLAVFTATTSTHLMGGATDEGLLRRVPVLLQAEAIRRAVQRGSRTFDLWGLPTAGLAANKAKWGGEAHAYGGAIDADLDRLRGPLVRAALRLRGFGG